MNPLELWEQLIFPDRTELICCPSMREMRTYLKARAEAVEYRTISKAHAKQLLEQR